MQMAAIQLNIFETVPQMESVLERMQAEADAGLLQVSDELEPDVRNVARAMVAIGLTWGDLGNDIVKLSADRFLATGNTSNLSNVGEVAEQAVCTLKAVVNVMEGVAKFFPDAVALAYVERLQY